MASGAIRLLTVPIIVHAVSANTFGTLATLMVVMVLTHGIADLGLGTAALRFAPECTTAEDRRSLFGTMLSVRAAVGLLVTAAVVALHDPLALWLTGSQGNGRALLWLALAQPLALLFDCAINELRARDAMSHVSGLVLLQTILVQGLSVSLVVGLGLELEGLVGGRVLGEALAFVVAMMLCWRFVRGRPSATHLRRLLAFGWPFGVISVLGTLHVADRPLIRTLLSVEHVASYELGMRLVAPVGVTNIALAMVLEPFVYRHARSHGTPAFVDLFVRGYVAVFATVAMALAAVGHELVTLIAPAEYREASRVLPAAAFAAMCEAVARAAGIGAELAKRTQAWAIVSFVTIAIGLGLAALLVPLAGITGVGVAWVVANTMAVIFCYEVSRRVSGIVLPIGRALAVSSAGALLGTAAAWQPWPLALRLALLVCFAFGAWRVMRVRWADLRSLI
jgi:O-antigen/teichoic acid export membrane protein